MSESLHILTETADRLFADLAADPDAPFDALWPAIEEAGFPSLLIPESEGGFGGDWQDAFAVLRLAGFHVLAAPVAEAVVAGRAVARAGLAPVNGLVTLAQRLTGDATSAAFTGVVSGVPFAREAGWVLASSPSGLIRLRVADATAVDRRLNPAGEPRDTLTFDKAPAGTGAPVDLTALAALARTAQIAGALDAALALSISHANDRVQFGKPIGKFQAVQQALAVFAEEAAAVNCAGQAAARAADRGDAGFEIAAAKLRAGMAAEIGAAVAHQTHGAIGFTREHGLHRLTRRLASWRSEFGGDRFWAERLAALVAEAGPDGLWPLITARGDAA
jgi:acyl-CoA dehydrogenase